MRVEIFDYDVCDLDTGSKRTGESKTAIMENTNQRLKLELEDKEIEHQSEGETTMAVMPCLKF